MGSGAATRTRALALASAAVGLLVVLWPFVQGLHSGYVIAGLFVGGLFLVGALALVSPSLAGETPIHRRGG